MLGLSKHCRLHKGVATGDLPDCRILSQIDLQHSELREEIRLHSLHITKEKVAQVDG